MDVELHRRRPSAAASPARLTDYRWSLRAQRLIDSSFAHCIDGLQEPLRRCLDEFAQELFAMAERAHRPAIQQDFFTSRQRVLRDRAVLLDGFASHLAETFSQIDTAAQKPSADSTTPAWSTLELLDPDQQELEMTVGQLGARGEVRHQSALYELSYRMAALIAAPPLEGESLPLGPNALSKAFHQAADVLTLPPAHRVLLLKQFDCCVLHVLAPTYELINRHLQNEGILPQLRSIPMPRHAAKRSRTSDAPTAETEQPVPKPTRATSAGGDSIEVLESLRNLLTQRRGGPEAFGAADHTASTDELQTALGALQNHLAQVTDHASRELRSAQRLREELLNQLNLDKPSGAPQTGLTSEQGDTVELVAMLFEQMSQQLQQGSNANAMLGELQLPVLSVAVADHDFFETPEHPARKLLDTVTAAAHDWLDGSGDEEANRPLATKLEQLVTRAKQEAPSAGLYTTLLADIEHHLSLLNRRAQAAERRHVEAAQGRERLDHARQRAGELMAERFAESSPRGLLRALLERAWSDVLALTVLRHGEDSEAFRQQLAITDQLLGRLPVSDRDQLQQDVESGLQQIGMHAEESVQVAQRLLGAKPAETAPDLPSATDLALRLKQHQRLGEHSGTPAPASPTPVASAPTGAPAKPAAMPTAAAVTKIAAEPLVPDIRHADIEKKLLTLPFGTWFEFVDPANGQISRRKLAWYSPMSGRCLLVNQRGQRGEEMNLPQLAHEVAQGRARELAPAVESLLDRAWRGLTGSLRHGATAPPGTQDNRR